MPEDAELLRLKKQEQRAATTLKLLELKNLDVTRAMQEELLSEYGMAPDSN